MNDPRTRWFLILSVAACNSGSGGNSRSIDPEAIRRACAMEVSCFASPQPITPGSSCVQQFELGLATGGGIFFGPSASDIQRYVDCAGQSSNCNGALDCASRNHGTDWCNAHPNGGCDGDTLIFCIGGWGLEQRDCSALGEHCGTANGASVCTDGNPCDFNTAEHCEGNRFVECDTTTGLEMKWDCGKLVPGTSCQTRTMGTITDTGCYPAPSASCPTDSVRCDGTAGVECSGGAQYRVECAQFASHCVLNSTGDGFDCVPDATGCTNSSPDSCDGDSLQICVNGNYESTACSSIGLTTCQDGRCQ